MQVSLEKKISIKLKCLSCQEVWAMADLKRDEPYRLPNPAGGFWPVTYYHCQCQEILVYEPGDGGDLILLEKAELVAL